VAVARRSTARSALKPASGKHRRTRRGARKGLAVAAGVAMLVPVVAASQPGSLALAHTADDTPLAAVGRGLIGLADPSSVGADGRAGTDTEVGQEILSVAGSAQLLALGAGAEVTLPSGPLGIPGAALDAYLKAERTLAVSTPNCHMTWSLLASVGRIESNHARGGKVDAKGTTVTAILGPVLNGGGFAAIGDTDGGALDGDGRWDRAVGPMQFIPSTWKGYASDGNGDGIASPHNVYDAALASGRYLCSGNLDMNAPQQRAAAVFRYNHSNSYVRTVLIWADAYAKGVTPLPQTPVPPVDQLALVPPVIPGVPSTPSSGTSSATAPVPPPSSSSPSTSSSSATSSSSVPPTSSTSSSTTTPPTSSPSCEPTSSPTPTSTTAESGVESTASSTVSAPASGVEETSAPNEPQDESTTANPPTTSPTPGCP